MKKRILTLILLLVAATFVAEANPVDLRTAQEVAVKFMNANAKAPMRGIDDLPLVTTYNISRGDAAFYVFNTSNGFVIVSADDCATPILGYSEEGQFDMENIPIQLQDYLQGFVEQIQYGIENHIEADEQTARQWGLVTTMGRLKENRDGNMVEPLITTTWSQGCYYNAMCPEDVAGQCGRVWTGCTATAMAQILRYWGYPEHGTGTHSYTPPGYPEQSVDFGATTYDWDNMPNILNYSSSSEQIDAVATLMWHCGVSVNMQYGTDESAAGLNPGSLINYFNYSNEMDVKSTLSFSEAIWKAKLKSSLNLNRPLYYIGYTPVGGHAFVCDGYDNNDMFHFNWGWGGVNDGYYTISAMIGDLLDNVAIFNIHPQGETTNYTINVSVNNEEFGTASGSGTFAHGENVTLSATANSGYGFCYWEENGGIASTDPNYSFIADYNRDLVAVFAGPFNVTTSTEEGGTVSGGGTFYYGEPCLVTATADEGYVFAYWTDDGNVFSYNPNYTFAVTAETHLVAHFVELSDDIIIFADGYVKDICVTNWDMNGDGLLSYDEAAMVTNIGEVFTGNTAITSFDELQYFTNLSTISDYAFFNCRNLTLLTIPNSITSIGKFAFCQCINLTGTLTIPNSVTTIGYCAFDGCRSLTGSLTIPNSVTTIGNQAFRGCSGFTGNLIISNSITEIEYYTFYGCSGLSGSLTLPNSITSIGDYAFYNCRNLTGSLTIPNSVTIIGESAFRGCSGFTGSLTISDSITEIGNYAFSGCSGLSGLLTIPNTITSIEDYTFYNCRNLTSLIVPNTISIINDYAFSGCSGLKSIYVYAETPPIVGIDTYHNVTTNIQVYVPCDDVESYQTSEGWNLFSNIFGMCYGIITAESNPMDGGEITGSGSYEGGDCCTLVATPNEGYCFANWKENGNVISLDSTYSFIVIGERTLTAHFVLDGIITFADSNVKAICVANWDTNGDGELSNAEALAVTSLGIVFRNNSEITSFEELQYFINLTSINNYAFYNCSGLTSVTIPQSVTSIGNYAFYNCRGFTANLIIPNSVTSIGNYAFSGCSGLTGDLTIPNSVTSIGNYAFYNCSGFSGNLTISNSVTSIGKYTFYNCNGLTGDLTIPNSVTMIGNYAFQKCSGFTGNLTISNSVSSIGEYAFSNCGNLTGSLTIPNSVITIGKGAFYYCNSLNGTLTIPNSVTSIGSSAFSGCSSLTGSLIIPNTVTSINYGTFSNCSSLTGSIIIPSSVTFIDDWAFNGCRSLTGSLTIPNSVETIGNYAFMGCSRLTSMIILSEMPPIIGSTVFQNVSTAIPVFVPCGSVEAYQAMDGWNSFTNIMDLCLPGTISVMADPAEGGEVVGAGTYESGTFCTVTATPNEGYRFANWIENGNVVSYDANHSFVVTGESLLTAHFVLEGNIVFADDNVKAICVSSWDTDGDGELSYIEAASVTTLSVVNIGEVFSGNTDITSFDELKYFVGLTSIGNNAFRYCSNLMEMPTLPSTITSIGNSAFSGCSGFTGSLTIPNSVIEIGSSAFYNCSGFTGSLTIPNSVTSIGSYAFYNCRNLESVIMLSPLAPTLGANAFSGGNVNYYIYVPYASLYDYKTATNWSNYERRIFPMAYTTVSGYGNGNDKWAFVASPLGEDVVPTTIDNMLFGTKYDLYQFNQSATDEEWQNYKIDSFNLVNGHGYVYANDVEVNVVFKGAFNEDETKVVSLEYDVEKANPGWNLVGNPFPVDAYLDRPYYVMNEEGTAINPIAVPTYTPIPPCVGVLVKANGTGESVTFSRSVPETEK